MYRQSSGACRNANNRFQPHKSFQRERFTKYFVPEKSAWIFAAALLFFHAALIPQTCGYANGDEEYFNREVDSTERANITDFVYKTVEENYTAISFHNVDYRPLDERAPKFYEHTVIQERNDSLERNDYDIHKNLIISDNTSLENQRSQFDAKYVKNTFIDQGLSDVNDYENFDNDKLYDNESLENNSSVDNLTNKTVNLGPMFPMFRSDRETVHKVSVLGLFELSTAYGERPEGNSELAAAMLAVRHINERKLLPGYSLELLTNDTKVCNIENSFNNLRVMNIITVQILTNEIGPSVHICIIHTIKYV